MNRWIPAAIVTIALAAPVAADSISVSIGAAVDLDKDPNVASIDQCTLRVDAKHDGQRDVRFTASVMPMIIAGTQSSFTFSILNREPVPAISALAAGQEVSENIAFQGLSCADIEFVALEPSCEGAEGRSDCGGLVVVSDDTVLDVVLPNAPPVEDVGPLHGEWGVFAEDGSQYLSVFISDDRSGAFSGHLKTQDAFCDFTRKETGCVEGQLDKAVTRVSGDAERMFMILSLTDNPNKDQIELTINLSAGTGQLANPSAIKFEKVLIQRLE